MIYERAMLIIENDTLTASAVETEEQESHIHNCRRDSGLTRPFALRRTKCDWKMSSTRHKNVVRGRNAAQTYTRQGDGGRLSKLPENRNTIKMP